MIQKLIFSLFFFYVLNVWAIPFAFQNDLKAEIETADFVKIENAQKQEWLKTLSKPSVSMEEAREIVNEAAILRGQLHHVWTQARTITVEKASKDISSRYTSITGEDLSLRSQHAIADIPTYIENRIGSELFKHLKEEKTKTIVLGSDPQLLNEDLKAVLPKGEYRIYSLPSLYEKWGLYRYWVQPKKSAEPYYAIVVPPSVQYVRHYATMLDSTSRKLVTRGYLNVKAQDNLKTKLRNVAKVVKANFGNISVLFFGYEKNWFDQIKKPDSLWMLDYATTAKSALGLNLHLIQVKHKATGKLIRLASLQPDQTVWGELASFYFEALLDLNPKIVLFMGSAGSLRGDLKPYQVSIPNEFFLPEGLIKIKNFLLSESLAAITPDVSTSSRHGLTYSPIQQTRKYVQAMVNNNVESVDVEQALVSRMIREKNKSLATPILFGAVNVITDQPYAVLGLTDEASHNLDMLDVNAKNRAKDKAAEIALQALDKWVVKHSDHIQPMSCRSLLGK